MLYPYQKIGVGFLSSRRTALLADDMGLGKTVQLIKTCEKLNLRDILVICPASVKTHWSKKWQEWDQRKLSTEVCTGIEHKLEDTNIVIINYDLLRSDYVFTQLLRPWDCIICDEAHYLKNIDTIRASKVLGVKGLVTYANRFYVSTGTPVLNRPKEMYSLLKVLFPLAIRDCKDYESFAYKYCGAYHTKWGLQDNGASNIEELAEKVKPFYIRRMKEDVLKELPEHIETIVPLEIDPHIQKVLDLLAEQDMSKIAVSDYSKFAELGWLASQRRQLAEAKLNQVLQFINEKILDKKDKVVIFAYHRNVIVELAKHLTNYGVSIVSGKTTNKQKEIDDFVNGKNKVFIGQINAAGQGIDGLQQVCDTVVFVEISWVPGENKQALDRLRRIGQKNTVFSYVLYIPNTLEDSILQTNILKSSVIDTLITTNNEESETKKMLEERLESLEAAIRENTAALQNFSGAASTEVPEKPKSKTKSKTATTQPEEATVTKESIQGLLAQKMVEASKNGISELVKANMKAIINRFAASVDLVDPKDFAALHLGLSEVSTAAAAKAEVVNDAF